MWEDCSFQRYNPDCLSFLYTFHWKGFGSLLPILKEATGRDVSCSIHEEEEEATSTCPASSIFSSSTTMVAESEVARSEAV